MSNVAIHIFPFWTPLSFGLHILVGFLDVMLKLFRDMYQLCVMFIVTLSLFFVLISGLSLY